MSDVFNRYNPAKRFARLLYTAKQFIETGEWNEQISIHDERNKSVGDAAFGAISLRAGGTINVNVATGTVRIETATVWAGGYMHAVPAATVTNVPMVGQAVIGVSVLEREITSSDDPTLKGIVPDTASSGKPLGKRLRYDPIWSMQGAIPGAIFYPIFTIEDGLIQNEILPPSNDSAELLVERHIYETHGSHIIEGFQVNPGGFDAVTQEQTFVIGAGVLRAQGRRVQRSVGQRYRRAENPTLVQVNGEVHTYPPGGVITLNNSPIAQIQTVTSIKEVEQTITHQLAGGADTLQESPVYEIVSVRRADGTVYSAGTDYKRTGDTVDWSPGGAEPSPGSTYTVRYRYTDTVTPVAVGRDTVTIEPSVEGLPVQFNYSYKLPRIDVLALNQDGEVVYIEGIPNRFNPIPPRPPEQVAPLVRIRNLWGIDPLLEDVDQRKMTAAEERGLLRTVLDLADRLSKVELQKDIQERDPSSIKGSFVDPFTSDLQRDLGIVQTAAVFNGEVSLPIEIIPQFVDLGAVIMLPYRNAFAIVQPFRTGVQKINEYLAFEPLPGALKIQPAVDRWNITNTSSISQSSSSVSQVNSYRPDLVGTSLYGTTSASSSSSSSTSLASSSVSNLEFLRSIPINFEATLFGPGEQLDRITFDGINVTASVTGTRVADATGKMTGVFTIPEGVRAGTKAVELVGRGGTRASANFVGQGTLTIETWVTTTHTHTTYTTIDPVAQSFRLTEPRIVTGVDVEFAARGDPKKGVVLDLRPVVNGYPTAESIAEGRISGDFALGDPLVDKESNWTRIPYRVPIFQPAGEERAWALLTDDANHSIAVAQLGKQVGNSPEGFDPRKQQWVKANPVGGVLFTSSNARTWLAKPEFDATHRILVAEFTALSRTVVIGTFNTETINPNGISDILVLLITQEPSRDTRIVLELVRASGEVIQFEPNTRLELPEYLKEVVTIRAILTGTATLSPIISPECQILWGRMRPTANYVSEAFVVDQTNADAKIRTVVEANTPGTSSMALKLGNPGSFQTETAIDATQLGDGWVEREYLRNPYTPTSARIEIDLAGTPKFRPRARALRARATEV